VKPSANGAAETALETEALSEAEAVAVEAPIIVRRHSEQLDRQRPSKLFIELQPPRPAKPAPIIASPPLQAPPARRGKPGAPVRPIASQPVTGRADKLRRRVFMGLLVIAIAAALVSVYNFVRAKNTPFGFGPPTEIEVLAQALNVRLDPGPRSPVVGVVARDSRHKVLAVEERGWYQIEVSSWSELKLEPDGKIGWVYGNLDGNPANVRVVSRRWWR
jgi:hypothetical protein